MTKQETKPVILHIINKMGVGGAEILLADVVKSLKDYEHIICNLELPSDDLDTATYTVKTYCLNYGSVASIPRVVLELQRIIRRHKVALIHAHLLPSVWIARLAWIISSGPEFIFSVHSLLSKDPFEKNRLSLFIERLTYTKRQHLIAVSATALNDYRMSTSFNGAADVLHNFVSDRFFMAPMTEKIRDGKLRLVAVGNLKEPKNYPFLLHGLILAKNYILSIFGDGPSRKLLESILTKHKLNVTLEGTAHELDKILPRFDAFISASAHEGFGISLAEAMACGLPVLVSDIPVFREVVGDAGFYFSLDDPNDLSKKIELIQQLKRTGALTQWGEKARARAMQIASQEMYMEKLRSIYLRMLE